MVGKMEAMVFIRSSCMCPGKGILDVEAVMASREDFKRTGWQDERSQ